MGDIESDGIDGAEKGVGVLGLFQIAHGRLAEAKLSDTERRGTTCGRRRYGCSCTIGCSGVGED